MIERIPKADWTTLDLADTLNKDNKEMFKELIELAIDNEGEKLKFPCEDTNKRKTIGSNMKYHAKKGRFKARDVYVKEGWVYLDLSANTLREAKPKKPTPARKQPIDAPKSETKAEETLNKPIQISKIRAFNCTFNCNHCNITEIKEIVMQEAEKGFAEVFENETYRQIALDVSQLYIINAMNRALKLLELKDQEMKSNLKKDLTRLLEEQKDRIL